jgi:uncharacterized protein (TIGR02246 family)
VSAIQSSRHDTGSVAYRLFALALITVLLAGAAGCASTGSQADTRSQILRLDAEWSRAAQERDVDRVVSYWAADAVVFPPGSPAVVGAPAIREFVVRSFQTPGFTISWKASAVEVSRGGDLAYATGTNRVTFNAPDGNPVVVEGKAVTVWRREPGGAWKCVIDIWNDTPAAK